MKKEKIISTHNGYSIISRIIAHTPIREHESFESWVIVYSLRNDSNNTEKPFEIYAQEGAVAPIDFSWKAPGVVEWSRKWIQKLITSPTMGERPVLENKTLIFDFNQTEKSSIIFDSPDASLKNGYKYKVINYSLFFSFDDDKLFFWNEVI